MTKPTVRMHLWLESEDSVYFGMGRVLLLDRIEEHGSLRKAAESLGMSYRAAWGKLRATEETLGLVLVETTGTKRGGYRLTAAGQQLRKKFKKWFDAVEQTAVEQAKVIFAESVQSYEEKLFSGTNIPLTSPPRK
ncbi:MAG: LysR family transcriptional regulator [Desulfomicrobium sp.]|nr:LysR family transcriptional regulator [Desulfomicrobium sp.]NLV95995.1 LysR family transcriptional regulator [Desulfovibrionales bacterium]